MFDKMLEECNILCSPGERFGPRGRGFVRFSALANQSRVMMAATRIAEMK
jgi:aspartate/methionine/tyrosine aminotransferase